MYLSPLICLAQVVVQNSNFWGPMQLMLMWIIMKSHRMNNSADSILPESSFYQMVFSIRLWQKAGCRPLQTGSWSQSEDSPALHQHHALETSNPALHLLGGALWCCPHVICTPILILLILSFLALWLTLPLPHSIDVGGHLYLIYCFFYNPKALWVTYQILEHFYSQ